MSWWRLRDPGSFPFEFHAVICLGEGEGKLIQRYYSNATIKGARREWHCFLHSLRSYSSHPTAKAYYMYIHRTKMEWNEELRMWEFRLTSRKRVLEDLVGMA